MKGQVNNWNAFGSLGNRQKVLDIWAGFADYPKAANADTPSDGRANAALIQRAMPGNHRQPAYEGFPRL